MACGEVEGAREWVQGVNGEGHWTKWRYTTAYEDAKKWYGLDKVSVGSEKLTGGFKSDTIVQKLQ